VFLDNVRVPKKNRSARAARAVVSRSTLKRRLIGNAMLTRRTF
jgi:hypothetical protein